MRDVAVQDLTPYHGALLAEDAELIASFLAGDSQAVATVDGWLARAAASFRRRTGDDWGDILQDVRLEVIRLLQQGRFRGESRLKTYLWQVTGHTYLDALRRRARSIEVAEEPDREPPSDEPSLLEQAVVSERTRAMLAALESTSPECRKLWSRILEGRGYSEMARELGVSEGTLRVRVHRCRKAALATLVSGNGSALASPRSLGGPEHRGV